MSKAQIIKTPGGEELVLLPRDEYESLVGGAAGNAEEAEDAADVAMFDQRMAELEAGRDARLPPEVSAAMLRGATLVRALRKWRGVKQQDLAAKAGLGQGYLSDIENGRRKGSDAAMQGVARALDIPPEWLVACVT